ncbi:LysR family transcriptional regulator [Niveispirillum sp. SYP-B3756]|uniref:LysR family transcriptional regulator n=1 Tax=Niveispirillum sp. SYP-B3756 TaxID=2662178 RepID=UPI0012911F9E|nr:LysR family transcriptional regulator [Niveispirillum sp. SYP-B3756]MQP64774.1 LysR family transcriptional regulator [Niveispirillum sp. SYP-B3756]
MELRDLEYFLTVVETGSLTLAARQRGLSQQALSKSLARLEGELGVALLERTPKGIMLTRMGEALLSRAQNVLAEVAHFRRDVDVALGRSTTQFAIGLSPIAASGIGRHAVSALLRRFPRLVLKVEPGTAPHFVRLLLAGEIDLAVTTGIPGIDPQIMATSLGDERWLVVGRVGNPKLAAARSIADLADADWIFGKLPDGLDERVDQHFIDAGIPPIQPRISTSTSDFGMQMLGSSDMLAILPHSMVEGVPGLMGRDLADGRWTTPLVLLRRRRATLTPVETEMIDLLRQEAGRLREMAGGG